MTLRHATPIALPDAVSAGITTSPPTMDIVDPKPLLDEAYRRGLSRKSVGLLLGVYKRPQTITAEPHPNGGHRGVGHRDCHAGSRSRY